MDYDNDGILDFISGSYDPGDLYLFRGEGNGKYAKVQQILDVSGQAVVHHPEEFAKYQKMKDDPQADPDESINARVASFGSWVAPVDWEGDGDLDLLIGSFGGDLFLRKNQGSRSQPVYETKSIPVLADGKPLHVNLHCDPVVADWNNDGRWDLIVGASDGAVGWFANTGTKTEPTFGPYQPLVSPASDSKFFEQNLGANDKPVPAVRAQICVTDYNLDGQLDLIVGDYSQVNWKRELSAAEEAELAALMGIQSKMITYAWSLREKIDSKNEEPKKKLEAIQSEFEKLERKKKPFFTSHGNASFIWLFLRSNSTTSKSATTEASLESSTSSSTTTTTKNPVAINVKLEPVPESQDEWGMTVDMAISPGWHLYSSVPAGSTTKAVSIKLEIPAESGIQLISDWERPSGIPSPKDPTTRIYADHVVLKGKLKVPQTSSAQYFQVVVHYQACTDQYCLPPTIYRKQIRPTTNR